MGLEHDAEQRISYDGILECWDEGCRLLGEAYKPRLASVHDPDEYLAAASSPDDRRRRFDDIFEAYRALGGIEAARRSGRRRRGGQGLAFDRKRSTRPFRSIG